MSDKQLTPRQLRAIDALMTARTITEAAKMARVPRSTLTVWLADDQFRAVLNNTANQAIDATVRRLAEATGEAVDVLKSAMRDGETTGVKVRAADVVLARLLALREMHELEQRISALEAAQAAQPAKDTEVGA